MLKVKVNGEERLIPQSWEEVTFGQYLRLITVKHGRPYSEIIAILLNISEQEAKKVRFEGFDVYRYLGYITTQPEFDPNPKKIGEFKLPEDITHETVEQFEVLTAHINKTAQSQDLVEQTKALAMYAAIYCNQGEFDEQKAGFLAERFLTYPCLEVMSAGLFFSSSAVSSVTGLPRNYLTRHIRMKKSRRGLSAYLRRSGFTVLWIRLRAMWALLTRRF